jgi:hypothetical protein
MVPRLFSICGCAQRAACLNALAGAGVVMTDGTAPMDVALETAQEYFWRLLIDWPRTMHQPIDAATVADVRRAIASAMSDGAERHADQRLVAPRELAVSLRAIAEQKIYGMPPAAWLALGDDDALDSWMDRGATMPAQLLRSLLDTMPKLGCSDVALMPRADREALMRALVSAMRQPRFSMAPTWDDEPVETGALARMRSQPLVAMLIARDGNSVAARMTARLVELATLLVGLDRPAPDDRLPIDASLTIAAAEGIGAVETARGLLLHRARLADGHIADYQIVAPTEWNFHPDGAFIHGLRGVVSEDRATLDEKVRLVVHALDPCVAFRIEVGDA